MKVFVGPAVVWLSLAGCTNALSSVSTDRSVMSGTEVPVVRLRAEPYSFSYNTGLVQPERIVIRDIEAWRSTWNKIYERHSPVPALPEIDFSKQAVIVAALGQRSSGGYTIIVESASVNDAGGLNVVVRSISPGSNCGTTAALTQPADVAKIPNSYTAVQFVEKAEVSNCGK